MKLGVYHIIGIAMPLWQIDNTKILMSSLPNFQFVRSSTNNHCSASIPANLTSNLAKDVYEIHIWQKISVISS